MINRVIFESKVYFRIADLAVLFGVPYSKMRKAIDTQNIKFEKLKGFGRTYFIQEKNVGKIQFDGKMKTVKTMVEEEITDTEDENYQPPVKKTKKKKTAKKVVKKIKPILAVEKNELAPDNQPKEIEELQEQHAALIAKGRELFSIYANKEETGLCQEICDKYLGSGNLFIDATLDDVDEMQSIVSELELTIPRFDF